MAAKLPVKDPPSAVKPQNPSSADADSDVVHVPSYSGWFSWDSINECEIRFLPEFFDSRSPSKSPSVYKYYRDSIIRHYRDNPSRKITFTDVRRILVGDVGSIRRVFDFLETWGLVNYSASAKPLKWEDKENKSAGGGSGAEPSSVPTKENSKTLCSGCKSVCSIACFYCDKYDLTLCARCYVRGNHRVGVSSSDFRRVEISEETRTDWTDKDTLQLLEAIMHYGDDWRKVAQHVGGRSEKDCITHFIKLRFGEEFIGHPDSGEAENDADGGLESIDMTSPSKRICLSPLADASNPIMAQAAFLSALAGVETAEAAAQAAVKTLTEVDQDNRASKGSFGSLPRNTKQEEAEVSNGDTARNTLETSIMEANSLVEKEERDLEKAISGIIEVQMREIQDKIVRFEKLDLQMEKERRQMEEMKNMLFVDQLSLLFHKTSAPQTGDHMEENRIVKPNVS